VQAASTAPSKLHSNVAGSSALNANDALVEVLGFVGWLSIVVWGSVVSGGPIVVSTVSVFAFGPGSSVVEVAVAVFESEVVPSEGCTTTVNVALAPDANVLFVHVTSPVPPGEGVVQANVGPVGCEAETKVLPEGTVSTSDTDSAADGPWLVSVMP
jgi:hypothetical protein